MNGIPNEMAETEDFEFAALNEAKNYRSSLLREFSRHLRGNVLEIGAGIGQFTAELMANAAITRLVSIEPDPKFCAKFRTALPERALVEGTIDNLQEEVPWNAILSINVLEHISADERELNIYRRKLAPAKGVLCLFVPARMEIYAPIDRDFGHFRRYTKPELQKKLEQAGFEILRLRYYNLVGYFAWWLNFCVLKKREFDLPSVRLFDRVIFPPAHGFERIICSPPIGQSLLVMARAK